MTLPGRPTADSQSANSPREPRGVWWLEIEVGLLVLLVVVTYFYRMGDLSLRGEESRRGLIAREMVETGDWIVPRTQGEPLLSRPPFQNWTIAWLGQLRGSIDVMAIRLPSALATLLTVLLIYGYARTFLSPLGAFAAGAAYATLGHVLELGRLGETEALFTFLVSASLLGWHWSFSTGKSPWWTWGSSWLMVALATLAKGPQAPVYFAGGVGLYLLCTRQWRYAFSWAHAAAILLFVAVVAAWQIPFSLDLGLQGTIRMYCGDVALRFEDSRWITTIKHLFSFPFEILAGCLLPWSFLLIPYVNRQFRELLGPARPAVLFSVLCVAFSFPSVWFPPEARPRYYMPLYPCFAVLIGVVVQRVFETTANLDFKKIWSLYIRLLAIIMVVTGAGLAVVSCTQPGYRFSQPLPFALVYCGLACAAAWMLIRLDRNRTPINGRASVMIAALYLGLSFNGPLVNSLARTGDSTPTTVSQLKQQLPAGTKLYSFGVVHHLFSFLYPERIQALPWSDTEHLHGSAVEYFCFDVRNSVAPQFPFLWEKVSAVSCDRYQKPNPDWQVVIGRRLPTPQVDTTSNPPVKTATIPQQTTHK